MSVKYVDQEFIVDNNHPAVLVIDVDLQGVWEKGYHAQMRWAFPRIYQIYQALCWKQYNSLPGNCVLIEDSGYKIALLFVKKHRNDKYEKVQENFEKAVKHLLQKVPSTDWIYSPIMCRKEKHFAGFLITINRLIKEEQYHWYVYKK